MCNEEMKGSWKNQSGNKTRGVVAPQQTGSAHVVSQAEQNQRAQSWRYTTP